MTGAATLRLVRDDEPGPPTPPEDLVADFLVASRRRGRAPATIDTQQRNLRRLEGFLKERDKTLRDATCDDIDEYLDSRRINARSRYRYLADFAVFWKWGLIHDRLTVDPTVKVDRPNLPRGLPRPISDADLALAIEEAPPMMRAWLLLASLQGLRCIEISRLRVEDIVDDRAGALLLVHGKGNKIRTMPLHPEVQRALAGLLPKKGPVFRRPDGQPFIPHNVSQRISTHFLKLGIRATAHQLRHWFGTRLYQRSGHDIRLVQELLGHASPTTTAVYAAFDPARARPAVEALNFADDADQ